MLYFDHNASAPLHPAARQAWLHAVERYPGNPSSPHRLGSRADKALSEAREQLADLLGCPAIDLVWTSGASESSNTVLHHVARTASAKAEVWVSSIEHPCVLEPARGCFRERLREIPVRRPGVVELDWLRQELRRHRPALVAVMAANNETGVLQPWRDVAALCREHRVPFYCDAAQWMGKCPASGLGACDFVSGSAHKFGGPRGVGFLKVPSQGRFEPLLRGGPQEEQRRAGTENVPAVLAMMAALGVREKCLARGEDQERIHWREVFEKNLCAKLPRVEIVGRAAPRLWNTVSVLMPARGDCAGAQGRWVVKLDKAGFAVSTGSACASGKAQPSHVLTAMGYPVAEADRVLRFSSGWETPATDWQALLAAILHTAPKLVN